MSAVSRSSPAAEKVALFRSLFRGREDVYPRRFESRKTGKSGYSPACANEWVRGVCEKPRVKRAECDHRRVLPARRRTLTPSSRRSAPRHPPRDQREDRERRRADAGFGQ